MKDDPDFQVGVSERSADLQKSLTGWPDLIVKRIWRGVN